MKKLIISSIVFLTVGLSANCQQLTFSSQYMINPYLTNPGAAGSTDYAPIALNFRQQWMGFDEAPRTQVLSGHMNLADHHGVGVMIYHDKLGPLRRWSFQTTYAYHVEFKDNSKLGLGLSVMMNQHALDGSTFNLNSTTDQLLNNGILKSTNIDADFGVFYHRDNMYVGISIPQLFQHRYKFGDNLAETTQQIRHMYLMGSYEIKIDNEWDVIPSFLMKAAPGAPVQFELSVRGQYNKFIWAGLSWRFNESVVPIIGGTYKDFVLGYSYDITTTNMKNYSSGTHELYLSYRLKGIKKTSVSRD